MLDGDLLEELRDALDASQHPVQLQQQQADLGVAILGPLQQENGLPQQLYISCRGGRARGSEVGWGWNNECPRLSNGIRSLWAMRSEEILTVHKSTEHFPC